MEKTIFDEQRCVRVDLLASWWPYTDGSLRATIDELLSDAQEDRWDAACEKYMRTCAEASYLMRLGTKRFAEDHPNIVWETLVPLCLPTTQVLLTRLADREETQELAKLLRAPMADDALYARERDEIELLLPQVLVRVWNTHRETIASTFDALRETQARAKALLQGRLSQESVSLYERAMLYGEDIA